MYDYTLLLLYGWTSKWTETLVNISSTSLEKSKVSRSLLNKYCLKFWDIFTRLDVWVFLFFFYLKDVLTHPSFSANKTPYDFFLFPTQKQKPAVHHYNSKCALCSIGVCRICQGHYKAFRLRIYSMSALLLRGTIMKDWYKKITILF